MTASILKIDNNKRGKDAKVELREHVLELVQPAHVFDVFCGIDGVMHQRVWARAESYAGCDKAWSMRDERWRYIGDSLRVLRCIDLQPFNVFDVDAYGDPWPALYVIMHRRAWAPGELGALVLTDGTHRSARYGMTSRAIGELTGLTQKVAPSHAAAPQIARIALTNWLARQSLTPLRMWTATANAEKGSNKVDYSAIVFQRQEGAS